MTSKKRKSLDDSLASEFVFNQDKEVKEPTTVKENKPTKESSLMNKLQVAPKEGTKRFTIDLKESVHRKLSILSAKTGRSKADIIRMVLDDVLKDIND